jgi:CRISPR type III-B/RAMP module-associated protein Cmr3
MNTLLLNPTDILFFRDGRPMGGASAGHGAAWPLPSVINHALHAALWRAGDIFKNAHAHRRGRSGDYSETRDRKFGGLVTAGPFPVSPEGKWFFPRPADADDSGRSILHPLEHSDPSSLQPPCRYPVVSSRPPSKTAPKPWWSAAAWQSYLNAQDHPEASDFIEDANFASTEYSYGIGIDSSTGSVIEGAFYSAHYLRLRPNWALGALATAPDKEYNHDVYGKDLIRTLLNGHGTEIIVGGQQRICNANLNSAPQTLPLPIGPAITGTRVKWVLLSPAIFPAVGDHPGGWLPSWVNHLTGQVELLDGPGKNAAARRKVPEGKPIQARLVAALVGKPIPVTGYALPHETTGSQGGAKPTHLAVPAGAVYYFEAEGRDEAEKQVNAQKLAAALNWHGSESNPTTIKNRRSTLMGEKGFGLGVCGTWSFGT